MSRRLVVLTGATRGLGRAMVTAFIGAGHTVAGCGRSPPRIEQLAMIHRAPHRFDVVDVTDDQAVAAWAAGLIARLGPPDLLINNAGQVNRNAPLWKVPAAEFARVIDTNLKGVANVIRHFVPAMVERRHGVIVNFSSGWGRSTSPQVAPYCASKWAVEGLTRALAQELPAGMAAVPFDPGVIDTDMLRESFGTAAGNYPLPKAWAATAVPFLLALGPPDNGRPLSAPTGDYVG